MQRIVGNSDLREASFKSWENIAPKIVAQAQLEAAHNDRIATTLKMLDSEESKFMHLCAHHGLDVWTVWLRIYAPCIGMFDIKFSCTHGFSVWIVLMCTKF